MSTEQIMYSEYLQKFMYKIVRKKVLMFNLKKAFNLYIFYYLEIT